MKNPALNSSLGASLAASLASPVFGYKFSSSDVDDQASALFYRHWEQRYEQLSCGPFKGEVDEIEFPSFTLIRETGNRILLQKGKTPGNLFAAGTLRPVSRGEGRLCGEAMPHAAIALIAPDTCFEFRTPEQFELLGVLFDPAVIAKTGTGTCSDIQESLLRLSRKSGLTPMVPIVPMASFCTFIQNLYDAWTHTPHVFDFERARQQIDAEFFDFVCQLADNPFDESKGGLCKNRSAIIKRMRDFIDQAPESALTVSDICSGIGVCRRTLQNTIRQMFGLSPQQYLKAVRLNALRRDLKKHDQQSTTVTQIAMNWGFWHVSQLAQDYRKMFNELPSDTLKNTPKNTFKNRH